MPADFYLIVEVDSVRARSGEGWFQSSIPYRLVNRSAQVIGLPGCHGPHPPTVERLVESIWVGHLNVRPACDEPPTWIGPGEVRRDTLSFGGCYERPNCGPLWVGDSAATMRLAWDVYPVRQKVEWGKELKRLPPVSIVSNSFHIRLVPAP